MGIGKYIGTTVAREDVREKSTGLAQYASDIFPDNCLHGLILRSNRQHARILSIEIEQASRVPGVEAVVTGQDFPDTYWGTYLIDQPIFAVDKVRYVGQPVAAVAGDDYDALRGALEQIEVVYEDLPAVFDASAAMSPDAPLIHENLDQYRVFPKYVFPIPGSNICNHFRLRKGDVEEGFRNSGLVFEDSYEIPMVQHCPMEPHACVVLYEEAGQLTIWTSTQGPHIARSQVADALGLPLSSVRVVAPHCGGGFGGKISACIEVLCSALAVKIPNRPVRMVFAREEEFSATFVRQRVEAEYKTGVTKEGLLLAREIRLVWDSGAFGDYEVSVSRTAGYNSSGPYRIPNLKVDSYCVYTNNPVSGAFRGFGVPEVCFFYEQHISRIANELGMDPVEIRMKNIVKEGDESATGQVLISVGLDECLRKVSEAIGPLK